MGTVYLSHTRGGQPLALKVIRREFAENAEFRRRFAREVQAARRVQGSYTATVLDSNTEGDQPWLASAYVPGPPLADAVCEHGPLPLLTVLTLMAGVAEALQSIHSAGVVHRDLKPSNVLLASDGPRVIDFGIARAGDTTALTGTDVRVGTPAYMSPEQAEGTAVGPALDIFALGLVAYFAATGRHPFGEGDGHALLYRIVTQEPDLTGCPRTVQPVIKRCLAKDPDQRPELGGIIEACRQLAEAEGTDLVREEGWWLPRTLASEATQMLEGTPPLPPSSPPTGSHPHTLQSRPEPPVARPRTTAATEVDPADESSDSGGPEGRPPAPSRRGGGDHAHGKDDGGVRGRFSRGRLMAMGLGACVVGACLALLVNSLLAGSSMASDGTPLGISAPTFSIESGTIDGRCEVSMSPSTGTVYVDLHKLKSYTGQADASDDKVPAQYALRYTDCSNGDAQGSIGDGGGLGPTSGLKLLDNRGSWGTVTDKNVSEGECRAAARSGSLPNPVTIASIKTGNLLKKNTGVCIELSDKSLVLLWINNVNKQDGGDALSDFATTARRWSS
ncbi:hypothetical protein BIV57_00780 [Mangrovactinospora gilvigrisea]|uniref:Protein kinase domain-containing protein n=2 Tax=Mangrovactinospora gilvigrisea TaxID=1428644 RepID=A0A1J7C103_9ACTN|nr:hypothetical protein BIV57_00780 [Mangrovactinospora gilvigrisea]